MAARIALLVTSVLLVAIALAPTVSRGDDPESVRGSANQSQAPADERSARLRQAREREARDRRVAAHARKQTQTARRNRNGSKNAPIPGPDYVDRMTEQGQAAMGFYVTGAYAKLRGAEGLAQSIKRAGLNAAVIDLKDGAGRVTYDSRIELLGESEVIYLDDPRAYVSTLKREGIYTIARIVCFADPKLPARFPDRAIQHSVRGTPWVSHGTGGTWLDPYNRVNHDLVVELAKEAASFGFDEIQLDYIRWPVDAGIAYAHYPAETEEPRSQVLLEMMRRIDAAVQIPLGVDVFGLTAFNFGNAEVLGQFLHEWTGHVEVITPMIYLHAMRAWGRDLENRNQVLIQTGLSQLRERMGPIPVIRPFLQSFDRGNSGSFDPKFIADQIRGARLAGADGFLFWHPGSSYGTLTQGMQGPARSLVPFPLADRATARAQLWGTRATPPSR